MLNLLRLYTIQPDNQKCSSMFLVSISLLVLLSPKLVEKNALTKQCLQICAPARVQEGFLYTDFI